MKRIAVLLCALLLLSCVGCGKSQNDHSSLIAICVGKAQEYIENEDYASAISILEGGIETTQSQKLMELLASVQETMNAQTEEQSDFDITICPSCGVDVQEGAKFCSVCGVPLEIDEDFSVDNQTGAQSQEQPTEEPDEAFDLSKWAEITYWSSTNIDWVYGGYVLEIYAGETFGNYAYFSLSCIQAAPTSRTAIADAEIALSEITSNEITFAFENDGWGHSGKVTLVLMDEAIMFTVSDVAYTDPSRPEMWGLYDNVGVLTANPDVYDDLYYTQDEYEMLYAENETDINTSPEYVYDTSSASGILTSMGISEQEFRVLCSPMQNQYQTGYGIVAEYNDDLVEAMRNYPADYAEGFFKIPVFVVESGFVSADGYLCYSGGPNIRVYDYRDNNDPVVSIEDKIGIYAVFKGLQTDNSGTVYLCFWLISLEK